MIARLCGTLIQKSFPQCIIDTNGVGYLVVVPLTTYYELPDLGERVILHIHTQVKDDAINLYGFWTEGEQDLFLHLTSISGIGPKQAINILSGIKAQDFIAAIRERNITKLTSIPGIGKKTAERLILELKDKITEVAGFEEEKAYPLEIEAIKRDALSALVNLGYKISTARIAIGRVLSEQSPGQITLDRLLKEALRDLAGGNIGEH